MIQAAYLIYEPPTIRLVGKGNGEGGWENGYGYYFCNSYASDLGHGNGHYHYLSKVEKIIFDFNLIYGCI